MDNAALRSYDIGRAISARHLTHLPATDIDTASVSGAYTLISRTTCITVSCGYVATAVCVYVVVAVGVKHSVVSIDTATNSRNTTSGITYRTRTCKRNNTADIRI